MQRKPSIMTGNYRGNGVTEKMTKRTDYKRYEIIPNVGIKDNLTGELLITLKDCNRHLNKLCEKNDRLVEEFYKP